MRTGESGYQLLVGVAVCATVAVVATQRGLAAREIAFWVALAAGCAAAAAVWSYVAGRRWPWTRELPYVYTVGMAPALILAAPVFLWFREWTAAAFAAVGALLGVISLIRGKPEQRS